MGFKVSLFIIQALIIQHAFSYPARDYILAYIPIEEYIYLTPTIEYFPVNTCYLAYPEAPSVSYYSGQLNSRVSAPLTTSGGFSVTCTSTPLPSYQSGNIETVTVISPAMPEVIVPSVPELASPIVPSNQYDAFEATHVGEFIDNTAEPIFLPEPTAATVVTATSPTIVSATSPTIVSATSPTVVSANPPVAGTVTFNGPLPAYGTIKIYATCC